MRREYFLRLYRCDHPLVTFHNNVLTIIVSSQILNMLLENFRLTCSIWLEAVRCDACRLAVSCHLEKIVGEAQGFVAGWIGYSDNNRHFITPFAVEMVHSNSY